MSDTTPAASPTDSPDPSDPPEPTDPWEVPYLRELRALDPQARAEAADLMAEDAAELSADAERWKRWSRILAATCVLALVGYFGLGFLADVHAWYSIVPAVCVTIAIAAFVALMATMARWAIRRTEARELDEDRESLLSQP